MRFLKALVLVCLLWAQLSDAQGPGKPNVIIIMTDDQGYGEISAHGNPVLQTPNLDQLHATSVRLVDFHASAMCTPTRGQLMSGMDAVRNGALNVSAGRSLLRRGVKTLADRFADAGYATGLFGKWHLGDNYPYRPNDRGFQQTLWFPSSHISSIPDYWGNNYFDNVFIDNGERERYKGFCTDVFFNEAKSWMASCKASNKPFFTYLPLNAPHQPFYAPEEDIKEIERLLSQSNVALKMNAAKRHDFIRYLAMIRNIDKNIGRLMSFLKEQHLLQNTIVLFLTDNGSTFGPDYFNAGMRGRKTELYEGGHRVPLFIHWPDGGLGKPRDIQGLTQVQDIAPTLLNFCNIPFQIADFDGISLDRVLKDREAVPDRTLFINYSRMPLQFDYPSPYSSSLAVKEGSAVLWKRWRLLNNRELYDLAKDPQQQKNIYDQYPEIVKLLQERLNTWWDKVAATVNVPERTIIGAPAENLQLLSACEWMDVFMDQQIQVKNAVQKNSYWLLEAFEKGTYELELRRWPRELDLPMSGTVADGRPIPLTSARMYIRQGEKGITMQKPVRPQDKSVRFTVELEKGPLALHTWLNGPENNSFSGAYYVYVKRISGIK